MRATPLLKILRDRIRASGPLTFAEYMEACLYHPEHGYYSRPEVRRFADYYTSVDVHPIFARLLARQLAEMWEVLGCPSQFVAVEAGAGEGRLAAEILNFSARTLPDFFRALRYLAVERGKGRREALEKALATHIVAGSARTSHELPEKIAAGCILSNEFFDALPVHRVVQEKGQLREIYVVEKDAGLGEIREKSSQSAVARYFSQQKIELQEGQHAEAGLAACAWMGDAARRLDRGFILTIDYGYEAQQLYSEAHGRGTVMAYEHHQATEEYYSAPGEQDLTAHVNFSALDSLPGIALLSEPPVEEKLQRTGLASQTAFLMALGKRNEFGDLYDAGQSEADQLRARLGLKTLIHPEGMGEMFKVLIQHKGIEPPRLTGLAGI